MTRQENVVAVIQPFVPNYRVGLFDALAGQLEQSGLTLEVWHAQPKGRVAARGNASQGAWSVPITQHRLSVGRRNITLRNVHSRARKVRAVVAGLASTNLETYGLAADPAVRLMLWGHGRNYTTGNNGVDQAVEGWLRRRSKHLFAYTESGKAHLVEAGAQPDDITVVQNSTDTRSLGLEVASLTPRTGPELRSLYELGDGPVGLFVGAFDEPKQLPLLFEATDIVQHKRPNFRLIVAGAGPEAEHVAAAAAVRSYVRLIGRADAALLARLSTVSSLVLIPGRVGLVAVDALALGIPIVTTDYPFHAPEADYLTAGVDSLWTEMSADSYARGVVSLLDDPKRLDNMSSAARARGAEFSVEQSATRFATGILTGLSR